MTSSIAIQIHFLLCRAIECVVDLNQDALGYGIVGTHSQLVALKFSVE